jgi:streptogramin lyase
LIITDFRGAVSRIIVDEDNEIWITTDIDGVYRLKASDGSIIKHYKGSGSTGQRLTINGASDLIQYNDSLYIIASDGVSILNKHTGVIQNYGSDKGFPDGVATMVKDNDGLVWLASSRGIASFDPLNIGTINLYNANDGVHSTDFNSGATGKLKNGKILFGTTHDFIVFDPAILKLDNEKPPSVEITGFEVMGKSIRVDSLKKLEKVDLPSGQNSFAIYLSTLTYRNEFPVFYKLEGIDKDWKTATSNNIVNYNYLPPGEYNFIAVQQNNQGR